MLDILGCNFFPSASSQMLNYATTIIKSMKDKNIKRNVFTYNSLIRVYTRLKVNDASKEEDGVTKFQKRKMCDDCFLQMKADRCVPNSITYNLLINIFQINLWAFFP